MNLKPYLISTFVYFLQGAFDMPMDDLLISNSQPKDSGSEELDALRGRYIRRLTAVIVHHIPAFWKVALSVSSGKFAKVINYFQTSR